MAIREKLIYAIGLEVDAAKNGLKDFRKSVMQADGTVGKFKAGAASALDSIKANAATLAAVGGAAVVAFGAKAVAAFQETAIEAGKFSDATGLAVEDASRWIEVAGDVGVSADTIQGAFVKLNKEIGAGSPILKEYGVGLITAADGTADVNQTMLTAIKRIGAIEDPTKRAEAAQAAFGRGYKEAAEIILGNADQIKKKLDEVSDAKVIDEAELEKARRFREAMDNINDIAEDLLITIGEGIVPALTDVAETASDIRTAFGKIPKAPWIVEQWWDKASPLGWTRNTIRGIEGVGGAIKGVFGSGGEAPKAFEGTTTAADQYVESLEHMHASAQDAADVEAEHADTLAKVRGQATTYVDMLKSKGIQAVRDLAAATDRARRAAQLQADAVRDQTDALLESLDTTFNYEKAQIDVAEALDELNEKTASGEATTRELRVAQIAAAEAALEQARGFAESQGAAEGSTAATKLTIDELRRLQAAAPEIAAEIQKYIDTLNQIPAVKSTQLVVTTTGAVTTKQTVGAGGRLVAGAEGAVVNRPTLALIGEAGPEAVVPLHRTPGNAPLPGDAGGGGSVTLNIQPGAIIVHAAAGANGHVIGRSIVAELQKEIRLQGNGHLRRLLGVS